MGEVRPLWKTERRRHEVEDAPLSWLSSWSVAPELATVRSVPTLMCGRRETWCHWLRRASRNWWLLADYVLLAGVFACVGVAVYAILWAVELLWGWQ